MIDAFSRLKRTPEEIEEMCRELREHISHHSLQFETLTYEEGVQNTIKWLFFNEPLPTDFKGDHSA